MAKKAKTFLDTDHMYNNAINIPYVGRGPVVYFLLLDEEIVYVGRSNNLYSRLVEHVDRKVFNAVKCIDVESHDDAIILESALIKTISPKYNIKHLHKINGIEINYLKYYNNLFSNKIRINYEAAI